MQATRLSRKSKAPDTSGCLVSRRGQSPVSDFSMHERRKWRHIIRVVVLCGGRPDLHMPQFFLLKLRDNISLVFGGSDKAAAAVRLAFAFDDTDDAAVHAPLVPCLLDPVEACGPRCPRAAAPTIRYARNCGTQTAVQHRRRKNITQTDRYTQPPAPRLPPLNSAPLPRAQLHW